MNRVALLVAFVAALSVSASAVELKSGNTVNYTKTQLVAEDVLAAGRQVSIGARIDGDVTAAGQSVTVSGPVYGSVMLAGNNVVMAGSVRNDVRIAGSTVVLAGNTTDNAYLAGANVTAVRTATVGSDLLAAGNTVVMLGRVAGDARLAGRQVMIGGSVDGNVYASGDDIRVLDKAVIKGNLYYQSRQPVRVARGARVLGRTVRELPARERARPIFLSRFARWLGTLLATILYGIVLILLFPSMCRNAASTVRRTPARSLGVGFVALVGTPVAAVIAAITVVGIPLALAALALYAILLFSSAIFVGLAIGQWTLGRFGLGLTGPIAAMVLGVFALSVIGLVPVIGGIERFTVAVWGLGALLVSWWRVRKASAELGD